MFQLLYLRFTQPRADPTAFAAMAVAGPGAAREPDGEPGRRVQPGDRRRAQPATARGAQPETPATVDQWNLAKSLAFYKARFADASNFTFVFVGSFTPEAIKPLVETYIASLPATHAHETWRDLGITPPTGVVEKTVEKGIAPKSAGGDRLLRAVRVRRCAHAGAADDDAAAAVAAARHDPAGARRDLQHHRNADVAEVPRRRNTRADRLDVRSRADDRARAARVRGDRVRQDDAAAAGGDGLAASDPHAGAGRPAAGQRLLLGQIARRYEDGGGGDLAAIDRAADRIAALTTDAIQRAATSISIRRGT